MIFTFQSRRLVHQQSRSPRAIPVIGSVRDRIIRAVACVLVPLQLGVGLPLPVVMAAAQPVPPAATPVKPSTPPGLIPAELAAKLSAPWQPPAPVRSGTGTVRKSIPETSLRVPTDASASGLAVRPLSSLNARKVLKSSAAAPALAEMEGWRDREAFPLTERYLKNQEGSPEAAALAVSLGIARYEKGYFSKSIEALQSAWVSTVDSKDPVVYGLANEAGIRLAGLLARVGRQAELESVLKVLNQRQVRGPLRQHLQVANEALVSMQIMPEHAFKCGPLALLTLRDLWKIGPDGVASLRAAESTPAGFTLEAVADMAAAAKVEVKMAYRPKGAALVAPAVVHWRADHYAAIVEKRGDQWLVRDPTFAQDFLVSSAALDDEASGYFLIAGDLPPGWRAVTSEESTTIFGRGAPSGSSPEDAGRRRPCPGMAGYSISDFLVSLEVTDTPVSYQPPFGPAVNFTLSYNQRGTFNFEGEGISHLGPQWTLNWFSYMEAVDSASNQRLYTDDGRIELYSVADMSSGKPHYLSGGRVTGFGTVASPYQLNNPDGSRKVFGKIIAGSGPYPKHLLSKIVDRFGNEVVLGYDSSNRLETVSDALGQVSRFYYADTADAYRITSIRDPFLRTAYITYDGSGRLSSITDPVNIVSTFHYEDTLNPDYLTKLTTPYGDTLFSFATMTYGGRAVEATDPIGRKERVEYAHSYGGILPFSEPAGQVPAVPVDPENPSGPQIAFFNAHLYYGTTLRWDHKTYVEYPPEPSTGQNYNKAHITKWLWTADNARITVPIKQSEKAPLESRVWYYYDGQATSTYGVERGPMGVPNVVARVLDVTYDENDPELYTQTTQVSRYTYTTQQEVASVTDPKGRVTYYDRVASNGIDVDAVRQKRTGGTTDMLADITWNTTLRLPQSITDAALKTTSFLYNTKGQPVTSTNALSETATLIYDANLDGTPDAHGYLLRVQAPVSGANTSFTYDSAHRVRTVTDSEGYTLTYDYDDLDRVTVVTYPDGTYEQLSYDRLDLVGVRDREGRWTRHWYNGVGQRLLTRDPSGRVTFVDFCYCGAPKILIDAEGNVTRWDYDIQGRLIKKTYADLSETTYEYAPLTSRLLKATDALGQEKHYTYDLDDALLTTTYVNAVNPTPGVTLTYETDYPRLETMIDGTGTTAFTYHPVTPSTGTLGAGRLAAVDGPLTNDTLGYSYDALGRLSGRTINGAANSLTRSYDALGRLDLETNVLGSFDPAYAGHSGRITSVSLPGGLSMAYGYGTAVQDFRLQSIALKNSGTTLSSHAYTHSPIGRIETWTQALSGQPVLNWAYGYDRADQLTDAVKTPSSGATQALRYGYDRIGNRVSETTDSAVRTGDYNELNQLEGWTGGGRTRVAGTLNEPGTVTVAGEPAALGAGNTFSSDVDLPVGTSSVQVVAKDAANNTRTANYSVTVTGGTTATYAYDDVGNLTGKTDASGTTGYTWDAENCLIKLTYPGGATTEMTYDGLGRRVRIVEKNSSATIIDDRRFIWDGLALAERRAADGITVMHRYFDQGVQANGNTRLYVRDHLGSINQLIDPLSPGAPTATFTYDPFGKRNQLAGIEDSDIAYTGHYIHETSGLHLSLFRAYDSDSGRWLSRDPIGENGGINLYQYVLNSSINLIDPLGLIRGGQSFWGGVAIGFGVLGLIGIGAIASPIIAGVAAFGIAAALVGGAANLIVGLSEQGPTNIPNGPLEAVGYIADRVACPDMSDNDAGSSQRIGNAGDMVVGGLRFLDNAVNGVGTVGSFVNRAAGPAQLNAVSGATPIVRLSPADFQPPQ